MIRPPARTVRDLRARDLLPLARAVLAAGGRFELGVKGESMAPAICDGDRVTLGPPALMPGSMVLAELDGQLLLHRLLAVEGSFARLKADGCRRQDLLPLADILGEVKAVQRASRWEPLRKRLRLNRLAQGAAMALALCFALFSSAAHAQCTYTPYIVVDGQTCDWTSSENPLVFNYNYGDAGIALHDAELTDMYDGGVGVIYGLEQFQPGTTFAVNDQVGLFLNITGDGTVDTACNANTALSFTCTATPCTTSSNWNAVFYKGISGTECQTGGTATTLNTTGTGGTQTAAFAISGTNIEFGASFQALGLGTTFLATPYSTTNLDTNDQLNTLQQQSFSTSTVGPLGALVADLTARSDSRGVTVGWVTRGEFGNLGFDVYRLRGKAPPVKVGFARGQRHAFDGFVYQVRDAGGRPGDRYTLLDFDQHGHAPTWHGTAIAHGDATLPDRPVLSRGPSTIFGNGPGPGSGGLATVLGFGGGTPSAVVPAGPTAAARLGVTSEGMYAVTLDALAAANVTLPTTVALGSATGQPTFVQQNGRFLFYAGPIQNAYDSTDSYLLGAGTPPNRGGGSIAPPFQSGSFAATGSSHLRLKQYLSYDGDAAGADPYVWAYATNLYPLDPVTFDAPQAATALGGSGTLVAHLLGGTTEAHHLQVQLNGALLGEAEWTGFGAVDVTATLPPSLLSPTGNTLTVIPIFDTGADYEFAMLESADLDYDRLPVAVNGEARFALPASTCIDVAGLGPQPQAWDVTAPAAAIPLDPTTPGPASTGALTVCNSHDSAHTFEVFDESGIHTPTVRGANPTRWLGSHHAADELIVTTPSLEGALSPLIDARRAQGLEVQVALLSDIDDAFASGASGPAAIQSFLRSALGWSHPPSYVLLVGGANGDPRDVLGTGIPDLVPTGELIEGAFDMRSASDTWYVAGADGVTPQVPIGRLPVDTVQQLEAVVAKLVAADTQGGPSGVSLLVTDVPEAGDADFPLESSVIGNLLSSSGIGLRSVSAGDTNPESEIVAALGSNLDLWHYVGHAGTDSWGNDFLLATQVAGFTNGRLPLLVSVDCLDGEFDNPTATPVGVGALLAPQGGSLASFVSSTVESPRDGHAFDVLVTNALLGGSGRIGDALLVAQRLAAQQPNLQPFVQTYNLIGDPASKNPLR